ncbi:MAG TPA: hypothetical protein P5234_09255 [Thermoanaerobaculaceae bacterium]|nr:hypothetical protein [Thermoanaerobaculaceae bacterium]HRS16418.1 hypothetical protein [Thermoanaerobaculaceae bacterium]
MRGPVGLFAPPDETKEWERFEHADEHGRIEVQIERSLLGPPYLKGNELLVSVEGHGRFRLQFA